MSRSTLSIMSALLVSGGVAVVAAMSVDGAQALKLFWAWSWFNILHVGVHIVVDRPGNSETDR